MAEQIIFFIFTIIVLGGGIGIATTKNLYYSALFLSLTLSGMAGYFVLLNGGFLAAVQIVVYVGAIAILILFAIMLSRRMMTGDEPQTNSQTWLAAIVSPLLFIALLIVVLQVNWPVSTAAPTNDTLLLLGMSFLGSYVIPFEVVSVLLLVALVGAIILARDTSTDTGREQS